VLSGEPDVVLDIVDASNLERNLYLTGQLIELGVPLVVALNMADLAKANGMEIDTAALSAALGCPVVKIVANRGEGIDDLKRALAAMADARTRPAVAPRQSAAVEAAVAELAALLAPAADERKVPAAWLALKLIEGDTFAETAAAGHFDGPLGHARSAIETADGEDCDIVIADGRYRFIGDVVAAALHHTQRLSATATQRIDAVVLNRVLGVPVFLFAMYLMFLFTISIGGAFIDFFDQAFGAVFVDGLGEALAAVGTPDWIVAIAKGFGSGVQTVSTFVPIIACLFLFLSFLEDSGYMARAAFVMDRAMQAIGLPGKSFVPLIVGFGCNVPAIMATRTLDTKRDRVLTSLMAPFMSCGARLPVFALFAAAFFPASGQNIVFLLYIVGVAVAVLTGLVLKSTLLQGEVSHFVMELPPYHIPTVRAVTLQAWMRLREFIRKAGQVIVPIVMVLSVLSSMGTDGKFGHENTKDSVLAAASHAIVPVFEPIGVTTENWPAAVGLFTGIFAKEAVIGTLNALYAQAGDDSAAAAGEETAAASIGDKLAGAVMTIPTNFGKLGDKLLDPLGINVGFVGDQAAAAQELEVTDGTFGAMVARFNGAAGAFAYMLLILLYTPCVAALGAMRHEIGARWMVFAAAWTTGVGYVVAVAFYQAATFADNPSHAGRWLIGCALALIAAVVAMWWVGRAQNRRLSAMPAE
jgi:ferrous iron transport protein B